jgi:hypothetical protein
VLTVLRESPGEQLATTAVVWTVEDVRVFDPTRPTLDTLGELALSAVDGDAQTVWSPGEFADATLGDDLDGIGLLLDLGSAREVRGLNVELVRGGADLAIYALEERPDTAAGIEALGEPLSVQRGVRARQRIEFTSVQAQWWLVWVTRVTLTPTGTFTVEVADVTVLGPG